MRKIKYAVIGFGVVAQNRIAREGFGLDKSRFDGHPQAELVGVADANPACQEAVESLGLKWFGPADAVFEDADVEAVFIATNNLSHAPLAEKAMQAGKHCLIDKPITTTMDDALKLQKLARDRGMSLAVDQMMTENVYNIRAKDLIQQGAVGQPNDVALQMEFSYGSTPEEAAAWRCSNPDEVGGPIGDVASHCLYIAEFLFGSDVASLGCVYTPRTLDIQVENGAFVKFELNNGVQGSVRVGFNHPRGGLEATLTDLGYQVYATKGILRSYGTLFQLSGHEGEPVKLRLEIDDFQKTETVEIDKVQNIYQAIIGRHAQSIIDEKPLDAADAVHNLELILACHRSAQQQGEIITF